MPLLYEVSAEAQDDLFEIWRRIAEDSIELANRIENEFHDLFASLGGSPGLGHTREDLTGRPVLFFPLYSFLIVYQSEVQPTEVQPTKVQPIRIMAVLRGKRNVKRILKERH